jgi:quercetin dioxygenase-like cupin family protein
MWRSIEFMSIGYMTRFLPCQLLFAAVVLAESAVPIENGQVKVIVATEQPRVATPLHEHKLNRVLIYEQSGTQEVMDLKRKPYTLDFQAGQAGWAVGGGQHVSRIMTNNPVTIVEIEIKGPGNSTVNVTGLLDPANVDKKHYRVEFENDQVRVLRVKIGPHESTPLHRHAVNRVVTYLTDQDFRVTSEDGKVEVTKHKAGDVSWAGPATHKEENLSDKPFEVVVTELKN